MPAAIDRSIHRLRRKAALAALLGEASVHFLVAAMLAGSAALLLRLLLDVPTERAALVFCIAAVTPFTAWARVRSRFLSREGAAAWLDVRTGGSGVLVPQLEVADERWVESARSLLANAPAAPGLRPRPLLARALAGATFAALALWVRIPESGVTVPSAIFDAAVETLQEQLETLQEQIVFDEETAEELEARMQRLEEEARRADNPEATFEALDRLAERLEQEALEARETAEQALESLADVANLARQDPAAAQDALERTLAELAHKGLEMDLAAVAEKLGLEGLQLAGLELPQGLELDPELLGQLSEEMAELLREKLEQLAAAGLLDFADLAPFELSQLGDLSSLDLSDLEFELCEDCRAGEP